MNQRELFFRHLAQTSPAPIALEITHAEGVHLYDASGKQYIDLIGGISVANTGHRPPKVVEAIREQAERYLHVLVYGEMIQSPQVLYAARLASCLPSTLDCVYFTNSGAEATEGAMKLAKRVTGRTEMIAFHQSYHGSTQGALSLMGDENWRGAFRPLLPGVTHVHFNDPEVLDLISENTACVVAESIQAERGVYAPDKEWMQALRSRCKEKGCLLVLDEIQTGFGRTGTLWAFESLGVVPDILLLGKALGGGMPLGAFIARRDTMQMLTHHPVLGHITTFGGHPVSCAAGLASLNLLLEEAWTGQVKAKEGRILERLQHPLIRTIRSSGLLIAVEFANFSTCKAVIGECLRQGVLTDWFLFAPQCLRLAPPLCISGEEIELACVKLLEAMDAVK